VQAWETRVKMGTDMHKDWAEKYSVDMLENYYYGHQWQGESSEWEARKYVINMFFPSINISSPSMLFELPKYTVAPRITRSDDPYSDVVARAKLQEDVLNNRVQETDLGFENAVGLALFDARFRFGVVQVGYNADFVENPNAGKPILRNSDDVASAMTDENGFEIKQPSKLVAKESLFLKWVPAKDFRVSSRQDNRLEACDWCGYSEWHYVDDLQANPNYKNTSSLKASGRMKGGPKEEDLAYDSEKRDLHRGMVKVWFVWDMRAKIKRVWVNGYDKFLQERPYSFLPFAVLNFHPILGQFYPLPPTYNWTPAQNELNDTREMQRIHRKRAVRRYLRTSRIRQEEFDKLRDGEDMVCAEVDGGTTEGVLTPVADAPLDAQVARNIPQSQDDFSRISGISGEAQQVAQSETATQANLIALNSQIRESHDRIKVAKWLGKIGKLLLMSLRENMVLPWWIKIAVDPTSPAAQMEAQEVNKLWMQITSEELGDIDMDIEVDLTSMSPVSREQERTNWLTFLGLVTNPQMGMVLMASPALLRKTAGLFGIHNERDLVELSMALQQAAQAAMMAQSGGAGISGEPESGGAAPGPTPDNDDITGQLKQQLPVEAVQ
jgi:hypothetical protein